MDCRVIPKSTCEGNHSILDRMEDVEDIEGMQAEVLIFFSLAIEKRQQIEGHLKSLLSDNGGCLKKLRTTVGIKQLLNLKTGTASAKKRLEDVLQEAKEEMEEAKRLWDVLNMTKSTPESTVYTNTYCRYVVSSLIILIHFDFH